MSQTISRRERRQQMRQQRGRRAHGAPPRGRISGQWIALGAVAIAAVVILALFQLGVFAPGAPPVDLRAAKYDVAGEVIGKQLPDEGNAHLATAQRASYSTLPPASGSHWNAAGVAPAPWGIKDAPLPDEATLHNLEHGGIVITYKDLDNDQAAKLKDIVRVLLGNGFPKIVLEPYAQLSDAKIAVTAWRWQLKLPGYDDVQIVKFVKAHYEGPDAPERNVR